MRYEGVGMRLTRRKVLIAFAAAACFIGERIRPVALRPLFRNPEAPAAKLANLFAHKESAATIGSAYLRSTPTEAAVPILLARLFRNQPRPGHREVRTDVETRRKTLAQQIRRDFATKQVVTVDGWVLSLTEFRLCGLATLV